MMDNINSNTKTKELSKYYYGWNDYRAIYGTANFEFQQIKVNPFNKYMVIFAYIFFALSVSMVIAPFAWVQLFRWLVN